jgi:SPX domain protein involved in polyphosphate accumulation
MLSATHHDAYRYERKFVFEDKQSAYVEAVVHHHPSNFHEIFHLRHVNNIYFDTPSLGYFRDNFEGNTNRQKVRIRWYGVTFGRIKNPILEFKIKKGELGLKRSFPLVDFELAPHFNAPQIQSIFLQSELPNRILEEVIGLQPKLINSYSRKYYRSFNHKYRFTIDQKLKYYSFSHNDNLFLHQIADFKNVILELKYGLNYAKDADLISARLPVRMRKYSKYMAGMENLYSLVT